MQVKLSERRNEKAYTAKKLLKRSHGPRLKGHDGQSAQRSSAERLCRSVGLTNKPKEAPFVSPLDARVSSAERALALVSSTVTQYVH